MDKKFKEFWETCEPAYAHLPNGILRSELNHYRLATQGLDLIGKDVVDYGCGGGYFGKFLFETFPVRKYTGIDIATRSIDKAAVTLGQYRDRVEFIHDSRDFKSIECDYIFSLACIQHFPSQEYFEDFISSLDESGCDNIILQIRAGDNNSFNEESYTNKAYAEVSRSTILRSDYVDSLLSNYTNVKSYGSGDGTDYYYMRYKKK